MGCFELHSWLRNKKYIYEWNNPNDNLLFLPCNLPGDEDKSELRKTTLY